jgi:hypothetical protein
VDSISSGQTQRTSLTISHTTNASWSDRLMLVGVTLNNSQSETVSGITYNGDPLAPVDSVANGTDIRVEIWSLVAPDTGAHNVVITFSANLRYGAKAGVMTFSGVNQGTPLGTFASASGNSTTATVNVSSATNELVFDTVGCQGNDGPTVCTGFWEGGGQSSRWELIDNDAGTATEQEDGAGSTKAGATSVTMSWDFYGSAGPWAIGAVPIRPAVPSVDITVSVDHTKADGSEPQPIVSNPLTIDANTSPRYPYVLEIGEDPLPGQSFTSGNPQRLRVYIDVTAVHGSGSFTLAYDGACTSNACSNLNTPLVTVPEAAVALLPTVLMIPMLARALRRRKAGRPGRGPRVEKGG